MQRCVSVGLDHVKRNKNSATDKQRKVKQAASQAAQGTAQQVQTKVYFSWLCY